MWQQISDLIAGEFGDLGDAATAARVAFRLLLAAVLGGLLGYERESIGKAAGLRTHMLVALGAAIFIMAPAQHAGNDAAVSRVFQGLIAGIGFLGAGAIVKGRPGEEIYGLTTAASIWTTAALGMTAGLGRAGTAILAAALALVILQVLPTGQPPDQGDGAPPPRPPS